MIATEPQLAPPKPAADTFEVRCRSLRFLAWEFDAQPVPQIQSRPELTGDLQSIFASTSFIRLITAAAAAWLRSPAPHPETFAPGLRAIPILVRTRRRITGLCLVVSIEPAFTTSKLFHDMCAESGLAPDACARRSRFAPAAR